MEILSLILWFIIGYTGAGTVYNRLMEGKREEALFLATLIILLIFLVLEVFI